MFFWWICGGESGLPDLFLHHLSSSPLSHKFLCDTKEASRICIFYLCFAVMDVSTDKSSSVLSSATSGLLIHQRHTSFLLQCFWYLSIPFDFSFSLHLHVLYTHFFFLHIIYFFPMLLLLLSRFSRVWLCATPQTAAHQAPPSLGFSRQEQWSGLPFPSPMHESEKWKWSCSVVSDSSGSHGLQPTRLFHPWDFPGKSTGVGCHSLKY